ncbi:MAG: hypothetical protein K9I02_02995 [Haliscomenobacter sp.]|nr:hypothetical protein [Haliscomenobacter sp.]
MKKIIITLLLSFILVQISCRKDAGSRVKDYTPVAIFSVSPSYGDMETVFILDAGESYDPEPAESLKVRWDFDGDGSWDTEWTTEKTSNFVYHEEGTFNITLGVENNLGLLDTTSNSVVVDQNFRFHILKDYLVQQSLDLDQILTNSDGVEYIVPPPATEDDLNTFLGSYYIMDIRSANDYANGHIETAINVAFSNILTLADNANNKRILLVDYTGQTSCYAVSLLRLSGYDNAQALEWGMCGWNPIFAASWDANISNYAEGHSNWSYGQSLSNFEFEPPMINAYQTEGEAILQERILFVNNEGFMSISPIDVIESPSSYFINNYFLESDYLGFGHISGAFRINPLLLEDQSNSYLNPDKMIVTYCHTGQESALITAFLRVLGYNAYSLRFGMNGLYNSNGAWDSDQWRGDSYPRDLPYVQ